MALFAGVAASAISSALTGRILPRVPAGPLLAAGSALVAGALAMEAFASALWLIAIGSAVFSTGSARSTPRSMPMPLGISARGNLPRAKGRAAG